MSPVITRLRVAKKGLLRIALSSAVILLCSARLTVAGPPLVIDDPGTSTPGGWEIILLADGAETDATKTNNWPALDLAYGASENIQLFGVIPRQKVDEPNESSKEGWGYGLFGVKWRFVNTGTTEVAFAPSYSVPLSGSSTIRGIIEDERILSLPLLVGWGFGDWSFIGQAAFLVTSESNKGWDYGFGTGVQLTEKFQLLGEIYGATGSRLGETDVNWTLGFDYAVIPKLHILGSVRSGLWSDIAEEDQLKYGWFLGVQWFTRP